MIELVAGYALLRLIESYSKDGPDEPPPPLSVGEEELREMWLDGNITTEEYFALRDVINNPDLPGAHRISKDELRDMWYRNEITSDEYFSLLSKYD